jgi:hypothetical protein
VTRDERPLSAVPAWLWAALGAALAAQIAWHGQRPPAAAEGAGLPPPPGAAALRLASFGEPQAAARLAMLYVQSRAHRELDYGRLGGWLQAVLELDPRSDYALFAAARIYAENPDPARARMALEFVYEAFLRDPNRRWPALAHAALLAKHRLKDLPLARRYASAVDRHTTARDVPLWAKQMEIFILEDMDQLEAARIMLGGLLQSGRIDDPAEARFLAQRLKEMEARLDVGSSTEASGSRRPGLPDRKN